MSNNKSSIILYSIWVLVISCAIAHFVKDSQNQVHTGQLKLLYNDYTGALNRTVMDMDGETGCYFSTMGTAVNDFSRCNEFYKKFAKNLKVTKFCKDKSFQKGCVPKYEKYTADRVCAGFSESMFNTGNQSFVMANRSIINIFNMPAKTTKPLFAVDVNGMKKPNKGGYDLFSLIIMRNENGSYYFNPHLTYCIPLTKGGVEYINDIYK